VSARADSVDVNESSLRVIVFDLPPVLRELVRRALDAQQMTSVIANPGELDRAVARDRPDAIIVGLADGDLQPESRRFLDERARTRVLGLGISDGRAVLYRLRPERAQLAEAVAPDEIPGLIRAALAPEVVR
jgi:hypothetical protein